MIPPRAKIYVNKNAKKNEWMLEHGAKHIQST
jgi:hypothetical protein